MGIGGMGERSSPIPQKTLLSPCRSPWNGDQDASRGRGWGGGIERTVFFHALPANFVTAGPGHGLGRSLRGRS